MDDIERFIAEDVGRGDITSEGLLDDTLAVGYIYPKKRCLLAGLEEAEAVFRHLGLKTRRHATDGKWVRPRSPVLTVQGRAADILTGERLALNFLMRMSGIATETGKLARFCARKGMKVQIAGTRKTVPGFREYDKKAIVLGGGWSHRMGLYDGILIKDNHIRLVSISEAVAKLKPLQIPIEVEVSDLNQALDAAKAGAAMVMLDNMTPEHARKVSTALRQSYPNVKIEISGGVTPENIKRYAKSADIISLGYLTHSVRAVDFSMDLEPAQSPKRRVKSC